MVYANCLAVGVGCTIGPFVGPPCVLGFVIDVGGYCVWLGFGPKSVLL